MPEVVPYEEKKTKLQDTSHPLEVSIMINAHGHILLTFGPHDLWNNKSDNILTSDQSSISIRNFRLPPRSSWGRFVAYYAASSHNFLPTFGDNLLVPSSGVITQKNAFVFLISILTNYSKKVVSYCIYIYIYFSQSNITLTLQHLLFPTVLIQFVNLGCSDRVNYFHVLGHKPELLTRDVKIYTEYGSKRLRNTESKGKFHLRPPSKVWMSLSNFHETHPCSTTFPKRTHIGVHENPTNALFDYTWSQTDRQQTWSQHKTLFLYFVKNA
jgi:hypothetical protein